MKLNGKRTKKKDVMHLLLCFYACIELLAQEFQERYIFLRINIMRIKFTEFTDSIYRIESLD